jgi:hypothetical protein
MGHELDAREIEPVTYAGTEEYFAPKISDEVLASLKDTSGEI